MNLRLERNASGGTSATCGTLLCESSLQLATLEPPWLDNRADVSCVPAGEYELIPYLSPTHGQTWRLHNAALGIYGTGFVPEGARSEVEIHAGNVPSNTEGCILVGLAAGTMLDPKSNAVEPAVYDSDKAVAALRDLLGSAAGNTIAIVTAAAGESAIGTRDR